MQSQLMVENLINDLLDLAKLENNTFQFSQEYFNLCDVLYDSLQMMSHEAHEKKVEMKAEIQNPDCLQFVQQMYGDKRRYM